MGLKLWATNAQLLFLFFLTERKAVGDVFIKLPPCLLLSFLSPFLPPSFSHLPPHFLPCFHILSLSFRTAWRADQTKAKNSSRNSREPEYISVLISGIQNFYSSCTRNYVFHLIQYLKCMSFHRNNYVVYFIMFLSYFKCGNCPVSWLIW